MIDEAFISRAEHRHKELLKKETFRCVDIIERLLENWDCASPLPGQPGFQDLPWYARELHLARLEILGKHQS